MSELIINASLPETRIALIEDGEIQELLIERPGEKGIVGNIYKGRVTRVLPGMQAAFVDIGLDKAAFLYVDDIYVHSEVFGDAGDEMEEGGDYSVSAEGEGAAGGASMDESGEAAATVEAAEAAGDVSGESASGGAPAEGSESAWEDADTDEPMLVHGEDEDEGDEAGFESGEDFAEEGESNGDEGDDDDRREPMDMGMPPGEGDEQPEGTVAPGDAPAEAGDDGDEGGEGDAQGDEGYEAEGGEGGEGQPGEGNGEGGRDGGRRRRRRRRGRRGRGRNGERGGERQPGVSAQGQGSGSVEPEPQDVHAVVSETMVSEDTLSESDRSEIDNAGPAGGGGERPMSVEGGVRIGKKVGLTQKGRRTRPEFKEPRDRNRRIRSRQSLKPSRANVSIADLLKEGQEVIVQVAKDPIATKGARLTCHVSLPGRHLVCMPTIDHIGVSRRIDRDDERRRLREFVSRNRERKMGFIVRTASGGKNPERWIKQDMDYLTKTWNEILDRAANVSAPAMIYEDNNSIIRAVRDWVTEDVRKIIIDSRYHFNGIQKFVSRFMPQIEGKVDLYQGDIPIFDAYGISTELHRALERKVWLKSGGYIVIDQAEALVAIDVNTGRYVGKKNLEDTILKTNLEAVKEIAYQLRLRNLGGIIILDLIDMEREENRQRVMRALEDALRGDRARPTIVKMTDLGLIEMTRKRTRDSLVRAFCTSCQYCEGKGFTKSRETVAYEILREVEREGIQRDVKKILVQAHADVIDQLAIDMREVLDHLERKFRKDIFLQAVSEYHVEQFEVSTERAERQVQPNSGRRDDRRNGGDKRDRGGRGGRDRGGRDRDRGGRDRGGRGRGDQPRESNEETVTAGEGGESFQHEPPAETLGYEQQDVAQLEAGEGHPAAHANGHDSHEGNGVSQPRMKAPTQAEIDDMDEEDRLAYLRAQAAQDAALANFGAGGGGGPGAPSVSYGRERGGQGRGGSGGGSGGGGGGGGGRGRRGRRSGRGRGRGHDRPNG